MPLRSTSSGFLTRLKHKLFAIFLIALILFLYISTSLVFREEDIDFKSVSGVMDATKIYFSWLGSAFGNMKTITTYAVKMDWRSNETTQEEDKDGFFNFFSKDKKN